MRNKEIAAVFEAIADLMEILDEDRFRINSYRKAARVIGDLTEAIEAVAADGRLEAVRGVGKSTAAKIGQYLDTGQIELHQELLARVPPELPGLLGVPGLGPKTVAKLWRQAEITSVDELTHAIADDPDRLTAVEGLGPKKVRQIWQSLLFLESAGGRILLGQARELAEALLAEIGKARGATRVAVAGSLRRGKETIGDIDLLCQATKAAAPKIIERFTAGPAVQDVRAKGDTKGSVLLDCGTAADLRVVPKKSFGAALAYFTGSKEHNVALRERAIQQGLKLNEYGLFRGDKQIAGLAEEEIYEALGLAFVPPELREDRGEIAAAADGALPQLVEFTDIRADLHMHSTASDGRNTVEEMIAACRDRGYRTMAFCDHSKSQIQAHGLDEKRLAEHVRAIRRAAEAFDDITVMTGIEVDIFKDGSLDFGEDVLRELDWVTASAHSALSMGAPDATDRLLRAIEHPCVDCIGHPSGRIINARPGMELDIDRLAAGAAAHDVALEINAHHFRLDLPDTHVRAAIAAGARICINTDAHSIEDLDMMRYGVLTARRGWATRDDVLNTWSPERLQEWLQERRPR